MHTQFFWGGESEFTSSEPSPQGPEGGREGRGWVSSALLSLSLPLPLLFSLAHFSLLAEPQSRDLNEDECEESICGIFLPSGWGSSLHLN